MRDVDVINRMLHKTATETAHEMKTFKSDHRQGPRFTYNV